MERGVHQDYDKQFRDVLCLLPAHALITAIPLRHLRHHKGHDRSGAFRLHHHGAAVPSLQRFFSGCLLQKEDADAFSLCLLHLLRRLSVGLVAVALRHRPHAPRHPVWRVHRCLQHGSHRRSALVKAERRHRLLRFEQQHRHGHRPNRRHLHLPYHPQFRHSLLDGTHRGRPRHACRRSGKD